MPKRLAFSKNIEKHSSRHDYKKRETRSPKATKDRGCWRPNRNLSPWRSETDLPALNAERKFFAIEFARDESPVAIMRPSGDRSIDWLTDRSIGWLIARSPTAFMHRRPMSLNAINVITMSQGRNATAFARAQAFVR